MRKCAYTGKEAHNKDSVVPKKVLGEEEKHNWAKEVPISTSYKNEKTDRLPNDIEIEIHETFYLLELAKLKVIYLEKKLEKLQHDLYRKNLDNPKEKSKKEIKEENKKKIQIKTAFHEREVIQEAEKSIEEMLEQRKGFWEK